ncbi:MAG: N-acetylmuramoyl-L-alanine amidase [Alphaproteobacteria bacterium]|nr:N-acetylmuramoyl-L-alanine amidase [Alphaproteobacteria bacterium]
MNWCADSKLVDTVLPSPNFDIRGEGIVPDMIVFHYTGMESADDAIRRLRCSVAKVSSHYIIDMDGRIIQLVRESDRAWHAGLSFWAGDRNVNFLSIGIEIVNIGHRSGYPAFPIEQMESLKALCLDIIGRYQISCSRIVGHSDISPARKIDPGEKFDWEWLACRGIGIWVNSTPIRDELRMCLGSRGPLVEEVQEQLALIGYEVRVTGYFDCQTGLVISAFQRHFRPALINGWADCGTRALLAALAPEFVRERQNACTLLK